MRTQIPTLLISLACSTTTVGQSLNIDFGFDSLIPVDEYAAAGIEGHWNSIELARQPKEVQSFAVADLQTVDQSPSFVNMTVTTSGASALTDSPETMGDDANLLDDYLVAVPGTTTTINFSGLNPGVYHVFIYAWAPLDHSELTEITIEGEGATYVGGDWTGELASGVTHQAYAVDVADGSLEIEVAGSTADAAGYLNAIQIMNTEESPIPPNPDLNGDDVVNFADLLILLSAWSDGHGCDGIVGFTGVGCSGDVDHDLDIDFQDLLLLLTAWTV